MIKFIFYKTGNSICKLYLINNIVGYREIKKYKPSFGPIIDTKSLFYKSIDNLVVYGVTRFVSGKYFKSIDQGKFLPNYIKCSKKEIKDYLQTKKFMLSFENKLLD